MSAKRAQSRDGSCAHCGYWLTPSTSVADSGWCANIRCADRHHIQPWRKADPALARDVRAEAQRAGLV